RQRSAKPLFPSSNLGVASKDRFRLESVFFSYLKTLIPFVRSILKQTEKITSPKNFLEVARKSTNPKTEKILYKRQFLTEIDIVFE
ncbi:MAG: hypothetical protein ACLRXW_12575, partial [Negativibacillus massiliensis]|uniref:hypothetical protein n=1 Tax=Negativibacillus massiliensis TaxID=1871035 RepID=UPI0039A0E0E0